MLSKAVRTATGEQKFAFYLLTCVGIYGLVNAEKIKKQRLKVIEEERVKTKRDGKQKAVIQKVPTATDRLADHPVVAWILENLHPWLNALCVEQIWKIMGKGNTRWQVFWRAVLASICSSEFSMAYHWIMANKVYKHIPFFTDKVQAPTLSGMLYDFLSCNFVVNLGIGFLDAGVLNSQGEKAKKRGLLNARFRPLLFLFKLFFLRVMTDFLFWAGHYLLHLRACYFIHKRHHEHNNVRLHTNYHFTAPDLAVEAVIPYLSSIITLTLLNPSLFYSSRFETNVLGAYVLQLEVASHSGKAIPTMSVFPPLSLFMREWDDWNSWFHATHHRLLKCNYSITPYWDWLFGTDRY